MDDDTNRMMAGISGAVIAHRCLLQLVLAKSALRTDDPVGYVRKAIETTILTMMDVKQRHDQSWMEPLMKEASVELELIGANLETRLAALLKGAVRKPPATGTA